MTPSSEDQLFDLIYGAALAPELWTTVIERFADLTGGSSGFLSRLNIVDGRGSVITARIDPSAMDRYFAHFAARNPLHIVEDADAYMRNWSPRILTDDDWMPKAELMRSEFYNDYMRRSDVHSVMMVRLAAVGDEVCVLNISRPERRGGFDAAALERARRVHPHLIRAFNMGRKLNEGQVLNSSLAMVFDESPHGLFLLDANGRLLRTNPGGERILARPKGLDVAGGRLRATEPGAAALLEALVRQAGHPDASRRRGGSLALTTRDGGNALLVSVAPTPDPEPKLLGGRPTVIVCVTDPSFGLPPPGQALRQMFGLTRTEVRVAGCLFEGYTVKEGADQLGISLNTARVHIARIFEKTGANRQSELIRLMMQFNGSLAAPIDLGLGDS